jgi:hypothetical protein
MAKYSYTAGMEARGLNWIFTPINTAAGTAKAGSASANMLAIQTTYRNFFASVPVKNNEALQIIILENLIISSGAGFINAVFFYNPNDPNRLPGDNIRFHDGAQDLGIKFIEPVVAPAPAPATFPSLSNDALLMGVGRLSRFVTNSSPTADNLTAGTIVTVYNAAGQSVRKTVQDAPLVNSPVAGQTRINFIGTWAQDYSAAAGGYFLL